MYQYSVTESGSLTVPLDIAPYVQLPAHSGPRHIVYHPTEAFACLLSELDCSITTLLVDTNTSALSVLYRLSSLPAPYDTADMAAAEIQVDAAGRYVYVSNRDISSPNRNRSSISAYEVNPVSGELVYLETVSSLGVHPRHFVLHGQQLIISNRDSNNIVTYPIDPSTGRLISQNAQVFIHAEVTAPTQFLVL